MKFGSCKVQLRGLGPRYQLRYTAPQISQWRDFPMHDHLELVLPGMIDQVAT